MSTVLTSAQTRFLRGQAHDLKALLQIGAKGLTPAFLAELDAVLEQHELEMDRVAALLPYDRDAGLMGNIVTVGLLAARDTILSGRRLGKI